MSELLYSKKFWLLVFYPATATVAGVIAGSVIAWRFPDEPHPVAYGAGTAVLTLVLYYAYTWWYMRKRKRKV